MNRLVWHTIITDVREHTLTVGGKRSADGKAELQIESAGWYIHIGFISLFVGIEEPPFKKGDSVKLTLEQEQHPNASQETQS